MMQIYNEGECHGAHSEVRHVRHVRHAEPTPAAALDALAARVARLHQGHRNPEAFYEQRSEIAGELRRLARALGVGDNGQSRNGRI